MSSGRLLQLLDSFFKEGSSHKYSERIASPIITERLDEELGRGSSCYPIVHVTGTNGKGSVVWKIATACASAGYKVGIYTSPHLQVMHERISINHQLISPEDLEYYVQRILEKADAYGVTLHFFEVMTVAAFRYFADNQVDLAVVEVGVGGLEDATNFITPILSVITSISLDHITVLGPTLSDIGVHKAGVIKQGVPVVLGPSAHRQEILKSVEEKSSYAISSWEKGVSFHEENNAIARHALNYLRGYFLLQESDIQNGLKAVPPCRCEVFSINESEVMVFDVAHNPDGFLKLFQTIHHQFKGRGIRLILGLSKTKEITGCLRVIIEHVKRIYLSPVVHDKLLSQEQLAIQLHQMEYLFYDSYPTLQETLEVALEESVRHKDVLIVAGSFYIMAEVKAAFRAFKKR